MLQIVSFIVFLQISEKLVTNICSDNCVVILLQTRYNFILSLFPHKLIWN